MNNQREHQRVIILGSTGSIGISTLDVIASNADQYQVYALTANQNVDTLFLQCQQFQPRYAVMVDHHAAMRLAIQLKSNHIQTEVLSGIESLVEIAGDDHADIVVAAIVGAAGLMPTLAAIKASKRVLLANKESLVMSGDFFMKAVQRYQATLLPVDSEHNAILQCMPPGYMPGNSADLINSGVKSICLTASGGPFREMPLTEMKNITVEQALTHPNWNMGPKVTIDSATMMNKGLEVVEAHWLFAMPIDQIEVVIHPQSVIHSMVRYRDGSVLAQMGQPDMRTPIAAALSWPHRIKTKVDDLDFLSLSQLTFDNVDFERFPCLQLVYYALRQGGSSMTIVNAVNEVAVNAFLQQQIQFVEISQMIERVLTKMPAEQVENIDHILEIDQRARALAQLLATRFATV